MNSGIKNVIEGGGRGGGEGTSAGTSAGTSGDGNGGEVSTLAAAARCRGGCESKSDGSSVSVSVNHKTLTRNSPVSAVGPVMDESADDGDVFAPMLVAALRGVIAVQVCCGDHFTVLLDAQGSVFTWGGNDDGCLGLGDDDSRPFPCWVQHLKAEFVAGISAGVQHVLARSEEDVWAWGDSSNGRLGLGGTWSSGGEGKAVPRRRGGDGEGGEMKGGEVREGRGEMNEVGYPEVWPCCVTELHRRGVVAIGAGGAHSGAATVDGELYMWGCNDHGQLGLGGRRERQRPTECSYFIDNEEAICEVVCGDDYTAAINRDRQLFTWGSAAGGQLGHGDKGGGGGGGLSADHLEPGLVMKLRKKGGVVAVHCGNGVTCIITDPTLL